MNAGAENFARLNNMPIMRDCSSKTFPWFIVYNNELCKTTARNAMLCKTLNSGAL
ncbi:hypothetical protein bcgnr5380_11770 [Bacillus cereus]